MREVKRQTRTLKFALEAHVGKIVEPHFHLEADTDDGSRCDLFLQDWERWLDGWNATGRAWKKLVAQFGESAYYRPAVARAVASGMRPKLYVGRYLGLHARTGSILNMTTDEVVTAVGFEG